MKRMRLAPKRAGGLFYPVRRIRRRTDAGHAAEIPVVPLVAEEEGVRTLSFSQSTPVKRSVADVESGQVDDERVGSGCFYQQVV